MLSMLESQSLPSGSFGASDLMRTTNTALCFSVLRCPEYSVHVASYLDLNINPNDIHTTPPILHFTGKETSGGKCGTKLEPDGGRVSWAPAVLRSGQTSSTTYSRLAQIPPPRPPRALGGYWCCRQRLFSDDQH